MPIAQKTSIAIAGLDTIADLGPDGSLTIVYDRDDGLQSPGINNGMAFDSAGAFFVSDSSRILKFPADGGDPRANEYIQQATSN